MKDEQFDELMRDAALTYNRPPDVLPLDEMWDEVSRRTTMAQRHRDAQQGWLPFRGRAGQVHGHPWLLTAAALVVGLALGRASTALWQPTGDQPAGSAASADVPHAYTPVTDRYLGQAAALLISLPGELPARRADSTFVADARELLLQTRLLLDSPAVADVALRTLLEDLEVVLIQLVRLHEDPDQLKLELLHESLENSDVIPRLRSAVADYITD
jgi:hypothetical protein